MSVAPLRWENEPTRLLCAGATDFHPHLRALFDNLDQSEELAIRVDTAIRSVTKSGWRGNRFKEREVRNAIKSAIGNDDVLVDAVFEIVKSQRDY